MAQPNELSIVVYVPNNVGSQEVTSTRSNARKVVPLNVYETNLMKPIVKSMEMQMDMYIQELKELEEPKDPKHMLAIVEFEDVGNKVEKKRGRKGKTKVIGPISVYFELPNQYFDDDVQRVLTRFATPLATGPSPKFFAYERIMNWRMYLRKRLDKRYDVYFLHLPSKILCRSKKEAANYILYEYHPSNSNDDNTSRKRKRNEM